MCRSPNSSRNTGQLGPGQARHYLYWIGRYRSSVPPDGEASPSASRFLNELARTEEPEHAFRRSASASRYPARQPPWSIGGGPQDVVANLFATARAGRSRQPRLQQYPGARSQEPELSELALGSRLAQPAQRRTACRRAVPAYTTYSYTNQKCRPAPMSTKTCQMPWNPNQCGHRSGRLSA